MIVLSALLMKEEKFGIMDVREIDLKCITNGEVYKVLTTTGGVYLPSVEQTSCDFIRDILCGDKLVFYWSYFKV